MQTKGRLKISVDKSHLKAAIVFTADPHGEVWNTPKIKNLLEENGIVEGIQSAAIESAVEQFAEAGEKPVRAVVAEGTPPVPPAPSEFSWKLQPIPEELRDDARWILEKAGEPHITVKKRERVQVEKKVRKKNNLPFGKPREETLKTWETRVKEDPVTVDPQVLESGWAEENQVLAVIGEAQEGKMGRSVYGKPLPVDETVAKGVYPGRGVRETEAALQASHSGVVRRGENWVEVIPFQHHKWELTVSKDQATCLLHFSPGKKDARPPKAEAVLYSAREKGFSDEELLPAHKIAQTISIAIQRQKPIKDVPVTKDRDAWFKVEASSDHLQGLLNAAKGSGRGKPLVLKEIGAAIKKSGFKNMDFDKIKTDLLAFYRGRDRELKNYVLAEGQAPTRGSDRTLRFSCTFMKDEELRKRQQDSLSDYPLQEVSRMAYVKAGNIVAELSSTDRGEEGVDVYGKVLPGLPGNDPPMELRENVLLKDDQLVAQESGILDVVDGEERTMLRVRPYREAKIEVQVAPDKMAAYISLEKAYGFAPPLSMDRVSKVLEVNKVFRGIDSSALSDAILQAREGRPVENVQIAAGNPPVESSDAGKIRFHVKLASGDQVKIDKRGQADFKAHDDITAIEANQLIAELPSAGTGKAGWNVSGETVAAKGTEGVELQVGDNIRREEQSDGRVLFYAERSGELEYDGKSLSVQVHHRVKGNVDMHSGNIKFPGTVEVSGNVQRGFYVMAGGDVLIKGTVEGALLSAGNSVKVGQGIVGGNKAVIRAKKDIAAMFVEEATLLSVGDITVKNNCLRCQVKCNGTLRLISDKGSLIGGKVFSKHGLEAQNLGNEKGTHTIISFGQDYLVADQIEQHEKEIERLKDLIAELDTEMKGYEDQGLRNKLEKVRREKLKNLKIIEKRSMRLFTLRERYEEHFTSKVVVRGSLYPGVVIESHGRFFETAKPLKNLTIRFNQKNGRIETEENNDKE